MSKKSFSIEGYSCGSNLFMWLGPIALVIVLCILLFGCVDQSNNISPAEKYEHVKSAAGSRLYKIQVFCPGKTMTFISAGDTRMNGGYVHFDDYITGERVYTTCPILEHPILRKRKTPITSEPEELDELLKNDVIGMMDKAKTPVEQVPIVEETEKKQPSSSNAQPGSQSNITINNYNK